MTDITTEETHGHDHDPDREREPLDETRLIDASDPPDGFTPRHAATDARLDTHPDETGETGEADQLDEVDAVDERDGVATGHVHLPEEPQATGTVYDHGTPVDDTADEVEPDVEAGVEPEVEPDTAAATAGVADESGEAGKWWPEGASGDVMDRWREAQIAFVDDPAAAVRDGRVAVEDAVRRITESLDAEVDRVSKAGEVGDTESLRQAMRGYRQLLDRLVAL